MRTVLLGSVIAVVIILGIVGLGFAGFRAGDGEGSPWLALAPFLSLPVVLPVAVAAAAVGHAIGKGPTSTVDRAAR